MSKYCKMRHQAMLLLDTPKGELITEPDELASYLDISFSEFIQKVYNKRIATALERNKALMKADLRRRWFAGSKIKAHELLYKLLANSEELSRLKGEGNTDSSSGSDPLLEVIHPLEVWDDESDPVQ